MNQEVSANSLTNLVCGMKVSKSTDESQKSEEKLRNFDLSVDEIKLIKAINDIAESIEDMKRKNTEASRLGYFVKQLEELEEELEDLRENTLIR